MYKDFFRSKIFSGIIIGIGVLIIVGVIFQAGKFVGLKKAEFSGRMGDNYSRIFDGQGGEMMGLPPIGLDLPGGHGSVGKIIKIDLPKVVVEDRGNVEKVIIVGGKTLIREFRDEIKSSDLEVGDFIVVLGKPNNIGEIEADLIRTMPDSSLIMGTSSLFRKK